MKNGLNGIKFESQVRQRSIFLRIFCFVFIFMLGNLPIMAQGLPSYNQGRRATRGIELAGLYGYQFGGSLYTSDGDVNIIDTGAWGVELDVPVPKGIQAVLLYQRQDTQLERKNKITGNKSTLFDMSVNYFQIGAIKGIKRGNVMPFGMFTLGATLFEPVGSRYDSAWLFSVNLGLGVKVYASERVGLRLQFNLLMPIQWAGGAIFWSPGSGSSVGITGGTAVVQGFAGGGLFIII